VLGLGINDRRGLKNEKIGKLKKAKFRSPNCDRKCT
jgi:hypothetical protein